MPAPAIAAAEIAASMLLRPGRVVTAAATNAARSTSIATPRHAAATCSMSHRASARENVRMAAVSQALVEFANHFRQPSAPGIEIVETKHYRLTLQPDFP